MRKTNKPDNLLNYLKEHKRKFLTIAEVALIAESVIAFFSIPREELQPKNE